jgi:uridine kinase
MAPIVVGIAGGTASGKTTAARALLHALGDRAALVHHDCYYRSLPPGRDPATWNFDHPDALETELLVEHLRRWAAGETVAVPEYDFARHRRAPEGDWTMVPARPVLLVEGILVLAEPALRACMNLRFFVHAPDDIRLARRIRRDLGERGRAVDTVLDQYLGTVRPMHERFVAPSQEHADRVLSGLDPIPELVDVMLAELSAR